MMEKEYVGLSEAEAEASSSAFNGDMKATARARAAAGDQSVDERQCRGGSEEEDEEELELGLSLGVKNNKVGGKSKGRGDYCRILTAKDFPTPLRSRASPLSSSSSSSVSSSSIASNRVSVSGSANPPQPQPPPSQVVVGWPPIRSFRMNSLINPPKENNTTSGCDDVIITDNNKTCDTDNKQQQRGSTSTALRFVKVKMDGDPIGRKIDLGAHRSYQSLAMALEIMFHKPTIQLCSSSQYCIEASKLLDGSAEFALTYQDKDGDWMLVGDVPWGMFLTTVKRLRIMRTSDANGLAPRFQSSAGGLLRGKHT